MVQLTHSYMTTGKTIALTRRTFVDKVVPLLFYMLSRFVIASLPRSKCLLISWLQSPSTVILEPKKIKSVTASTFSPYICHEMMGSDTMILVSWKHFLWKSEGLTHCNTSRPENTTQQQKEGSIDTGKNLDGSQGHYIEYIIPFIRHSQNEKNYRNGKQFSGCQELRGTRERGGCDWERVSWGR